MRLSVFHPATCLSAWLAALVGVQRLSGSVLALACVLLPMAGARMRLRGVRLVWRARWLLLSLAVIFACGTPGDPLWNGAWAPTQEGVFEALRHLGRLWLVFFTLAAFLESMSLSELLAATRVLLAPLGRFGVDADRGVVRLMLVLRYVETLPRPRDWRTLLEQKNEEDCTPVECAVRHLSRLDRCLLGLLACALIALWMV